MTPGDRRQQQRQSSTVCYPLPPKQPHGMCAWPPAYHIDNAVYPCRRRRHRRRRSHCRYFVPSRGVSLRASGAIAVSLCAICVPCAVWYHHTATIGPDKKKYAGTRALARASASACAMRPICCVVCCARNEAPAKLFGRLHPVAYGVRGNQAACRHYRKCAEIRVHAHHVLSTIERFGAH